MESQLVNVELFAAPGQRTARSSDGPSHSRLVPQMTLRCHFRNAASADLPIHWVARGAWRDTLVSTPVADLCCHFPGAEPSHRLAVKVEGTGGDRQNPKERMTLTRFASSYLPRFYGSFDIQWDAQRLNVLVVQAASCTVRDLISSSREVMPESVLYFSAAVSETVEALAQEWLDGRSFSDMHIANVGVVQSFDAWRSTTQQGRYAHVGIFFIDSADAAPRGDIWSSRPLGKCYTKFITSVTLELRGQGRWWSEYMLRAMHSLDGAASSIANQGPQVLVIAQQRCASFRSSVAQCLQEYWLEVYGRPPQLLSYGGTVGVASPAASPAQTGHPGSQASLALPQSFFWRIDGS
jgi:hypothetical protein